MGWNSKTIGQLAIGALFALNACRAPKNLPQPMPQASEDTELTQKLMDNFGDTTLHSQIVFILPFIDNDPSQQNYWARHTAQLNALVVRDALLAQHIPAFVLGNVDQGLEDLKPAEQQIDSIQKKHHYKAATLLAFNHGSLYNYNTDSSYITREGAQRGWRTDSANLTHYTNLGIKSQASYYTYYSLAQAGHFDRFDVVSFSCMGGALKENEINVLPPNSTFVALCGPDQINYTTPQLHLADDLRTGRMDLKQQPDGLRFLSHILSKNMREDYTSNIVVMTSKRDNRITFTSPDHSNSAGKAIVAAAANTNQIMQIKNYSPAKPLLTALGP